MKIIKFCAILGLMAHPVQLMKKWLISSSDQQPSTVVRWQNQVTKVGTNVVEQIKNTLFNYLNPFRNYSENLPLALLGWPYIEHSYLMTHGSALRFSGVNTCISAILSHEISV